jgi:hypothetical protein
MWPFRHMGMESMSVLACAMNESLLQSYDGVLRVAPAALATGQARFTLHAEGGFIVSSEVEDGAPKWISIDSALGGDCALANPWKEAHIYREGSHMRGDSEQVVHLATAAGERWLLVPTPVVAAAWMVERVEYAPNDGAKLSPDGWAQLGLERMF